MRCTASRRAPTASARRPTSRSACAASRPGRSPPSASRRRSATSAWSGPTATTDRQGRNGRRDRRVARHPFLRHNAAMVAEREAGVGRRGIGAALGALIGQRSRPAPADPALPFAALAAGFAAAPFGVYGADRQGRLRWANAALAELLGLPVERLIADAPPLAGLLAGPLPAARPPYDLVGSDADHAAAEIELRRGDGPALKVFL